MSLFSFFRKKNKAISSNNRQYNNEIKVLYSSKKYDEIISKVLALIDDRQEVPLETKQILALSYFYKEDYENSVAIFMEIAQKKNDVESWFNCLNPLLFAKKMQEAKNVFTTILKIHKGLNANQPRELAVPFVRYYYACGLNEAGLFDEALEQLEELKKAYMTLKITDDTFLYMRGVPFLSNTLELSEKVFTGLGIDFANSNYLEDLKKNVDDDGKTIIKKYEHKTDTNRY